MKQIHQKEGAVEITVAAVVLIAIGLWFLFSDSSMLLIRKLKDWRIRRRVRRRVRRWLEHR
ncbi:hypothetical protein HYV30_03495 [Candidatus Kaiserbacteria bacterium]|nr:hypothetical protein [Candidatus Kaiserbacteria bacterium]